MIGRGLLARIQLAFQGTESVLVCPRCEEPLANHNEGACARRMSRRYFFGICAGSVGALIIAPNLPLIAAPEAFSADVILTPRVFAKLVLQNLAKQLYVCL